MHRNAESRVGSPRVADSETGAQVQIFRLLRIEEITDEQQTVDNATTGGSPEPAGQVLAPYPTRAAPRLRGRAAR
ncbi:hypothetical protein ACWD3I_24195 [Streptomyces sp. NPDC002817]|uniref:hypothetical protein n=1 Tax=Streptomyces sp. NPDC088357 TaxID=3154655 RepID=UPI003418E657